MKHAALLTIVFAAISTACGSSAASGTDTTTPTAPTDSVPVATDTTDTTPTTHPAPDLSAEHAIGVCAASRFVTIDEKGETTAVLALSYPGFSDLDYEVSVYMEAFLVSLDDPATKAYLDRSAADAPEGDMTPTGPTVLKQVEPNLWRVIARVDLEVECPGAKTPWD